MTEQSKHSPLPWSVSHGYNIFTQYGQCVATTRIDCGVNTDFALNLANAAHIVHCVNTHDALEAKLAKLVEALKVPVADMECPAVESSGEWHTGLHCGLEDRDIGDRYQSCDYGYGQALDRVSEWVIDPLRAVLAEIREEVK